MTTQRGEAPAPLPEPEQVLAGKNDKFDEVRQNIVAPIGAASHRIDRQAIEAMPQGNNATLDKVLCSSPVSRTRRRASASVGFVASSDAGQHALRHVVEPLEAASPRRS